MFFVYVREVLGDLIVNYLAKITLPKWFADDLGNVFVPNGTTCQNEKFGLSWVLGPYFTQKSHFSPILT